MKVKVNAKEDRFEVILTFPDARMTDLEVALEFAARANRWNVVLGQQRAGLTVYRVDDAHQVFQATVRFTFGMEPPTWAYIENKRPGDEHSWRAAANSTRAVAEAFLRECADRGLVSDARRDLALTKLGAVVKSN
jgi:hypothetical protein